MTALASVAPERYTTSGPGFRAVIYPGTIYLTVDPDTDIAEPLTLMLTAAQLPHWTVEWSNEEPGGWDTYLLTREACVTFR